MVQNTLTGGRHLQSGRGPMGAVTARFARFQPIDLTVSEVLMSLWKGQTLYGRNVMSSSKPGSSKLHVTTCHVVRVNSRQVPYCVFLLLDFVFLAPRLPKHLISHNPAININQQTYILDNFERLWTSHWLFPNAKQMNSKRVLWFWLDRRPQSQWSWSRRRVRSWSVGWWLLIR